MKAAEAAHSLMAPINAKFVIFQYSCVIIKLLRCSGSGKGIIEQAQEHVVVFLGAKT